MLSENQAEKAALLDTVLDIHTSLFSAPQDIPGLNPICEAIRQSDDFSDLIKLHAELAIFFQNSRRKFNDHRKPEQNWFRNLPYHPHFLLCAANGAVDFEFFRDQISSDQIVYPQAPMREMAKEQFLYWLGIVKFLSEWAVAVYGIEGGVCQIVKKNKLLNSQDYAYINERLGMLDLVLGSVIQQDMSSISLVEGEVREFCHDAQNLLSHAITSIAEEDQEKLLIKLEGVSRHLAEICRAISFHLFSEPTNEISPHDSKTLKAIEDL